MRAHLFFFGQGTKELDRSHRCSRQRETRASALRECCRPQRQPLPPPRLDLFSLLLLLLVFARGHRYSLKVMRSFDRASDALSLAAKDVVKRTEERQAEARNVSVRGVHCSLWWKAQQPLRPEQRRKGNAVAVYCCLRFHFLRASAHIFVEWRQPEVKTALLFISSVFRPFNCLSV